MTYHDLTLVREGRVGIIAFNRPDKLNALGGSMREDLEKALQEVKDDEAIRVLVLTGKGRAFCVGADLPMLQQLMLDESKSVGTMNTAQAVADMASRRVLNLVDLGKPTIAAVNGPAIGAGMAIAACCDIRLAATSAKFGALFVKRGMMPDNGLTYTLARIVGLEAACRLMFTGDVIDATEAERIRLVSQVMPDGELMAATMGLAERIAANAPVAVGYTKEAVYRSLNGDLRGQLGFETEHQIALFRTNDAREGVASFLERREPRFRGN